MPTLKRTDFPDKQAFTVQLSTILAQQGTGSPAVRDLMALANEDQEWWKEAELLYQRRHDFEQLIGAPNSGPVLTDGIKSLSAIRSPTWIIALFGPIIERLGPAVTSVRIQGILIGLVMSILGYLGINLSSGTPKSVDPQHVASMALPTEETQDIAKKVAEPIKADDIVRSVTDKLTADPKLKEIAGDSVAAIATKAQVSDLAEKAVKRIAESARVDGIAKDAADKIAANAKVDMVAKDAADKIAANAKVDMVAKDATDRIVAAAKPDTIASDAAKQFGEVLKSENFTKSVTSQVDSTQKQKMFTDQIAAEVASQIKALNLPKSVVEAILASDALAKKVA